MLTELADRPPHFRSTVWMPFTLYPRAVNDACDAGVLEDAGADIAIVTWLEAVAPALSVTLAVIVCTPDDSVLENDPPLPSCPSRLDVHRMAPVRLPSCASLAEPENVTEVP